MLTIFSVPALRRARASVVNAVEALSEVVLVASAESEDSAPAVELVADILVHLAEFVKLAGDLIILDLNDLRVLLEGILFSKVVNVVATESRVCVLVCFKIFSLEEQLVFSVFKTGFQFAHLKTKVLIARCLELVILAELIEIGCLLVSVSAEDA